MKNKKKILIFIDWFLPGFRAGGPVQSCANLVDHLKDDFDISVITLDTDYMELKPYQNIKSDQWNIRHDGTRVYYFSKKNLSRSNMKKLIETEKFDHVYLNGIFSKNFTLIPLDLLRKKHFEKIIVAVRGMLAPSALNIKSAKKKVFLASAKLFGLFSGITFQATNEEEAKDIKNIFGGKAKIKLAPNLPRKATQQVLQKRKKEQGYLKLINVARIAPEKNLLFALEVLSKIKSKVEFDFYGPVYDNQYWVQCNDLLSKLPPNIKASYKGVLDHDRVEEELSKYHFMFMPTRGENFGHVILQSLSSGTPVIISDQTPWKDLAAKKIGCELPLDDQKNFILALEISALLSQEEFDRLSASAYAYAGTIINDKKIIEQNRLLFR